MLSNNLLGQISLDTLCAGVPAGNPSFRIHHVDCIVCHALHEEAELLFGLSQFLFGCLALGEITRDLGEADQFSIAVSNRVDNHMRPEPRAIHANTPVLALEPLPFSRGFKRLGGKPQFPVLRHKEFGKVLTDNFGLGITLESGSAGVPAGYNTIFIQHIDSIICDRINQNTVTFFSFKMYFGFKHRTFPEQHRIATRCPYLCSMKLVCCRIIIERLFEQGSKGYQLKLCVERNGIPLGIRRSVSLPGPHQARDRAHRPAAH